MNKRFINYRYLLGHKASAFPGIYTGISRLLSERNCYTNAETDIVIDGFPRCANTYATYAFKIAQARDVNIAHHIHKQSQFLQAKRYHLPSILLIRKPIDCISSLLIRQPIYEPETLFKGYFYLYNNLRRLDSFVTGEFNNVLNNYGDIIKQVNLKFETDFTEYIKTEENEKKVKEIIQSQDELVGAVDYKERVAYPTAERKQRTENVKQLLCSAKYSELRKKCDDVYNNLIAKA